MRQEFTPRSDKSKMNKIVMRIAQICDIPAIIISLILNQILAVCAAKNSRIHPDYWRFLTQEFTMICITLWIADFWIAVSRNRVWR